MTSLNPSHIPLGFGAKDPQKSRGQAVYQVASDSLHLPPIPDLRFEQSYMRSIAPYVHWRDSSSSSLSVRAVKNEKGKAIDNQASVSAAEANVQAVTIVSIEWSRVIWITVRDQVISPLLQGTVWGVVGHFVRPLMAGIQSNFRQSSPSSSPKSAKEGDGIGWLRQKLKSFMIGGVETNVVLSGNGHISR